MALSVLVVLVLTPAPAPYVVKPASAEHHLRKGFFGWFNARFDQSVNHYTNSVGGILWNWPLSGDLPADHRGMAVLFMLARPSARRRPGVFLTMIQLPSGTEAHAEVLDTR